ncbi:MAG: TldD/PmbA family protein [Oligoflexales bacterium]
MHNLSVPSLLSSMRQEITRSMESLRSPRQPRPYYISYLITDVTEDTIWGRYGALCESKKNHKRSCYTDVRVGSFRYDHVTHGGLQDNSDETESYNMVSLPIEDNERAVRFSLWRLTDARYREAVAAYHERKSNDVNYEDDNSHLASFVKQKPVQEQHLNSEPSYNRKDVEAYIRETSRVFEAWPAIKSSYIEFNSHYQTRTFTNSEGSAKSWDHSLFTVTAFMWFHIKGETHEATLVFNCKDFDDLPTQENLEIKIKERFQLLTEVSQAEKMTSYAGPVLLESQPAGLFLHEVIGHRLEGSRLLSDDEGKTFKDKLGKRIMPKELSIYDDPTLEQYNHIKLVGSYKFDDEGTKAQRVNLIERGVLKNFLSTRAPHIATKKHQSNGHARNESYERPISRMSNLVIESSSQFTSKELKQQLIEEIKRKNLPYGIRLIEVEGGETGTESYDFQAFLGEITIAAKVFPDGSEEWVRGVDFVGTPLSSLANIIAVSKDISVDNGFCGAESGFVPVSTVSPAMLVSNLELQAKHAKRPVPYTLPLPWLE